MIRKTVPLIGVLLLVIAVPAWPQGWAPAEAPAFTAEDLEQIVAPIALYPDSLLLQVLMASTYPLEIVQADRWLGANPDLAGDQLDEALQYEDWDPAVKSLCSFRDLMRRLNDNLDWTQDMGDAFLAQQDDVLDAVQRMRARAAEAGNLRTTEQQVVVIQQQIIIIREVNTQVVYVPVYYPTVVYGPSWRHVWRYPVLYAPPPRGWGMLTFSAAVWAGAALWVQCDWDNDWRSRAYGGGGSHNRIRINVDVHDNYVRRTNSATYADRYIRAGRGGTSWTHDATHRRGVNYRSRTVADRYAPSAPRSPVPRDAARGYDRPPDAGTWDFPPGTPRGTPRDIPPETPRGTPRDVPPGTPRGTPRDVPPETPRGTPRDVPPETPRGTPRDVPPETPRGTPPGNPRGRNRDDSALTGSEDPTLDDAARNRGQASRGKGSGKERSDGRSGGGGGGGRGGREGR